MKTKQCIRCGVRKPMDKFYKHPQMADGRLNACVVCVKRDVGINYRENIDRYRRYDVGRANLPHRAEARRRYSRTAAGIASRRMAREKWDINNRNKKAASILLKNSILAGRVKKPKECSKCGALGRIEGHHEDYTRPLDVIWLCRKCHVTAHGRSNPYPNGVR